MDVVPLGGVQNEGLGGSKVATSRLNTTGFPPPWQAGSMADSKCSFCGRMESRVAIYRGSGVAICRECVELLYEMTPPDSPERDEYEKAVREGRVRGASGQGGAVGVMGGRDSTAESGSTTDVIVQCEVCGERIELIGVRKAIELTRAVVRHNRNSDHRFILSVPA